MPAPQNNKNAQQGLSPKAAGYRLRLTEENLDILQKLAKKEKIKISKLIENALIAAYPKEFDGKF